ncbi:Chitin synthase, class 3, partial [Oleoguttula sp. CCFEE 5521]
MAHDDESRIAIRSNRLAAHHHAATPRVDIAEHQMHRQSRDLLRPRDNAEAATHESAARRTLASLVIAITEDEVHLSDDTEGPEPLRERSLLCQIRQLDRDPMMDHLSSPSRGGAEDITRKRSLIRPERRRQDDADPNYYYRQHAQNMNVMPSTTGNDPQLEEDFATMSSQSDPLKPSDLDSPPRNEKRSKTDEMTRAASKTGQNKLIRKGTRDDEHREKE